ncbi:hypothetical protein OIU76_014166 [Salix suchowensis]|nr:hypothetical protein OIU76_014166 [Salix suchowensis]
MRVNNDTSDWPSKSDLRRTHNFQRKKIATRSQYKKGSKTILTTKSLMYR